MLVVTLRADDERVVVLQNGAHDIGRNHFGIADTKCSRKQVTLTVEDESVILVCNGPNPSQLMHDGVNMGLVKGQRYVLGDGDMPLRDESFQSQKKFLRTEPQLKLDSEEDSSRQPVRQRTLVNPPTAAPPHPPLGSVNPLPSSQSGPLDLADLKQQPEFSGKEPLVMEEQEVVLFVGAPGSGKTTFYKRHYEPHGYAHVNRDTLGTKEKCLEKMQLALAQGRSCVIDNTNPSPGVRKEYINAAATANVQIRCLYFTTPLDLAKQLNEWRHQTQRVQLIPQEAYTRFQEEFKKPASREGFHSVKHIKFIPHFASKQEEAAFSEAWSINSQFSQHSPL